MTEGRSVMGVEIQRLEATAYTVPTDAPEGDGTLAWDSTTVVVVEVEADGVVGTGWTYGPAACASLVQQKLTSEVVGRDALDVQAGYHAMVRALRNAGRPGIASLAVSAVDTACWDLKARLLGLPLHRLLGGVRETVPAYGSGGFTTYDEQQLCAQVDGWMSAGMRRVKIKIGESWGADVARDVARTRTTRSLVGDDVELFVDANGAYTASQARRVFGDLEPLGVTWFEEPVSSDDLLGLRDVREHVTADVTAGEYGYDLTYFERMCAAGAVDCLQIDVTRCGGITEWMRVSAVAAAHHLDVSGHCAPALHTALGAVTANFRHLEYFHDHVRIESMFFDGLPELVDGSLVPSPSPGNGLTLRRPDVHRYQVS